MRYQHLLCLTSPRSNISPDGENIIIKIIFYDKDGVVVNEYSNLLMKLNV